MSSQGVFYLCLEFVEEFYGIYDNEALFVLQMLEPMREDIEWRLNNDFDEETMSWRDYSGTAFEDLPDFLNPENPVTTTIAGPFEAGVAGVSNSIVRTTRFGSFHNGQIIRITGARDNNGLYEVHSHEGLFLIVCGDGPADTVETYTNRGFTSDPNGDGKVLITLVREPREPDPKPEPKSSWSGYPKEQYPQILDPRSTLFMQSNIDIADMARRLEVLEKFVRELNPVAYDKLLRLKARRGENE